MATILGIGVGVGLLFLAIFQSGGIRTFIDIPSAMITFGGTIAATFIAYPMLKVLRVFGVLFIAFRKDIEDPTGYISLIVQMAAKARQQSVLSLEADAKRLDNRFLRTGIEMIVDGQPPELIRDVLETEMDYLALRHGEGAAIFRTMGKYGPAFGLIGTLIGLIAMLKNLGAGAIETLGPNMAIALVTTFYGAMLANLLCLPVAEKLSGRTAQELVQVRLIIEGILMIQAGMNPRLIEGKLNAFLPPELRASYYDKTKKAAGEG